GGDRGVGEGAAGVEGPRDGGHQHAGERGGEEHDAAADAGGARPRARRGHGTDRMFVPIEDPTPRAYVRLTACCGGVAAPPNRWGEGGRLDTCDRVPADAAGTALSSAARPSLAPRKRTGREVAIAPDIAVDVTG